MSYLTPSLAILAFTLLLLSTYFLIRNRRRQHHIATCQRIFETLFTDCEATEISQDDRNHIANDIYGLGYGEITFTGFSELLAVTRPKPFEVFYDLGAGAGKAVICAALLYDWKKCCGIELLPNLHQLSLKQLNKLQSLPHAKRQLTKRQSISLIHGDFLAHPFQDADVIFINATCFTESFWENVALQLDSVKAGTRIILTSKQLDEARYLLKDARMVEMSWGLCSVRVYSKLGAY